MSATILTHAPVEAVPFRLSSHATLPLPVLPGKTMPDISNKRLQRLHEKLVSHAVQHETECLDSNKYFCRRLRAQDEELHQSVNDIVNYSYNLRYLHDRLEFEDVAYEADKKSEVFTVQQRIAGRPIVLITARVVLDKQLDCFELFTGYKRPKKAAEYVRFAYHPLLDVIDSRGHDKLTLARIDLHKRYLFRILLHSTFRFLQSRRVRTAYLIIPPHFKRYMDQSGFRLHPVREARFVASDAFDELRSKFVRYWKPEAKARQQPSLYTLDYRLNPLKRVVQEQSVCL